MQWPERQLDTMTRVRNLRNLQDTSQVLILPSKILMTIKCQYHRVIEVMVAQYLPPCHPCQKDQPHLHL